MRQLPVVQDVLRTPEERFIDTVRRLGIAPFKAHVYADKHAAKAETLA